MKKYLLLSVAILALLSCRKEETISGDFETDNLIDINLTAGMDNEAADMKVSARGTSLTWDNGDAIGIFYGSCVNSKFTLVSGAGSGSATFSGQLPTGSKQNVFAYYPYDKDLKDLTRWYVTLEGQVYDGDFSENGISSNYRKYAYMVVKKISNVSISSQMPWPEKTPLNFTHKTGLVQFDLSSTLSKNLTVDNISLSSRGYKLFINPYYINMDGSSPPNYVDVIGVDISAEEGHTLSLPAGNSSAHKYVQLVVMPSGFKAEGNDIDVVVSGYIDGKRVKYTIEKSVTNQNNFATGKRTKIKVPIKTDSPATYASTIKISQSGSSLVAPEFNKSAGFEPDVTVWGDGTKETYCGGARHTYSDGGSHEASVSCWSNVTLVSFDNLENITAIDFSNF